MRRYLVFILAIVIGLIVVVEADKSWAEFWIRQEDRERNITRPEHFYSEKHERLPTSPIEDPSPTSSSEKDEEEKPTPLSPSPTGRIGAPGNEPSNNADNGENGQGDDSDIDSGDGGLDEVKTETGITDQVKTPPVKGLSDTSGENKVLSDIMLLAGVLCLSLYLKSKVKLSRFQ